MSSDLATSAPTCTEQWVRVDGDPSDATVDGFEPAATELSGPCSTTAPKETAA